MDNQETKSQSDIEWEQRTLCMDESCIGVIGPDGRCKECGLAFDSQTTQADLKEHGAMETEDVEEDKGAVEGQDAENQTDLEWEQRTLCIDESCIGVIGSDSRCKECGLPYKKN